MKHSDILRSQILPLILLILSTLSCDSSERTNSSIVLNIHDEITIYEIQQAFERGDYTIRELDEIMNSKAENYSFEVMQLGRLKIYDILSLLLSQMRYTNRCVAF